MKHPWDNLAVWYLMCAAWSVGAIYAPTAWDRLVEPGAWWVYCQATRPVRAAAARLGRFAGRLRRGGAHGR